jgi:hypothetical protein
LEPGVCASLARHLRTPPGPRLERTIAGDAAGYYVLSVRVYGLFTAVTPDETLDLYARRAEAELRKILGDERRWVDVPRVVEVELDTGEVSPN